MLQYLKAHDKAQNKKLQELASSLSLHIAAMKPIYLFENELPIEARDQVVNEQTTPEGKKRALEKLIQRDVFMEQELATSEEPLKIKDLLKMKETELKTQITIQEWALFNIGA